MKAKDTVMDERQLRTNCYWATKEHEITERGLQTVNMVAIAQAEISFKAGYEEGIKEEAESKANVLRFGKKAGIREVVEWIKGHQICPYCPRCEAELRESEEQEVNFMRDEWQAKLKEWGINEA